jgi:hypothetical protein
VCRPNPTGCHRVSGHGKKHKKEVVVIKLAIVIELGKKMFDPS